MAYSIVQVAKLAKVTSRTLRHYDEIGLLPASSVGENGYRYYRDEQLLRLQQILVLRELGLGLEAIAKVLDRQEDQVAALRLHHSWLVAERDRLAKLAETVSDTIDRLKKGRKMDAERMYKGFTRDSDQARVYAEEAERRWGKAARESTERVAKLSDEQWNAIGKAGADATARIAALMAEGAAPSEARVLDAVDAHYQWIRHFWTPNREAYTGLGAAYVEDERFKAHYERVASGLATYLRDAMAAYASARLA
jgi:DNA-binding transcriptional MerR regulator